MTKYAVSLEFEMMAEVDLCHIENWFKREMRDRGAIDGKVTSIKMVQPDEQTTQQSVNNPTIR